MHLSEFLCSAATLYIHVHHCLFCCGVLTVALSLLLCCYATKENSSNIAQSLLFFFFFVHTVLSQPPYEPLSMVHSKTCIPFHYKQEIHSSRKTPCGGYTLSVVALTSAAHNESLKCERLKMQKDRRRPDTCHPFHPEVFTARTHMLHTQITHYYRTFFHKRSSAN